MPNTTNPDRFQFSKKIAGLKSYEFFSEEDLTNINDENPRPPKKPLIPGSEIRGVIRSAFEAVTNSCMSTITTGKKLAKRYSSPSGIYPSIIVSKNGKLTIEALRRLPRGQKSNIKFVGEPFGNRSKRSEMYFEVSNDNRELNALPEKEITDGIERFKENLRIYRENAGENNTRGYRKIETENPVGAIVFYKIIEKRIYLSPAQIGRDVFANKIEDIIKNYSPCDDIARLCPACLIFGMVGKRSLGSRLSFTDAELIEPIPDTNDIFHKPTILPELSSPKISATEFYLKRPDSAHIWNYDYAGTWTNDKPRQFAPIKNYRAKILGRKFYFHKKITSIPSVSEQFATERNVAVRPINPNVKFKFKIHFRNITENSLKKLIWVLTIGGKSDSHAHKIGMGKPLGLGSVKISAQKLCLRKLVLANSSIQYQITDALYIIQEAFKLGLTELGCPRQEILDAFLALTQFNHTYSNQISYPQLDQQKTTAFQGANQHKDAVFHWFMGNKQLDRNEQSEFAGGTGTNPIICQTLGSPTNPTLKKYFAVPKTQGYNAPRRRY